MSDAIVLDPAVELFDAGQESGPALCHPLLCAGMVVPRGEGMLDLLRGLAKPRTVADLVAEYEDESLVHTITGTLLERGFVHRAGEDVAASRERARLRPGVRDTFRADLGRFPTARPPPGQAASLELTAARLADHTATFAKLAELRRTGKLLVHGATIHTADGEGAGEALGHLFQLGAELEISGLSWPHPREVPRWVAEAVAARLGVGLRLRVAERDLTPAAVDACAGWAEQQRLGHVTLSLAEPVKPELLGECLDRLEDRLCDVRVAELPSDPVIVGAARAPAGAEDSPLLRAHLKRRIAYVRTLEGRMTWGQSPIGEEHWLPQESDLLPNHPHLLQLQPGKVIAEVGGGLGRASRRLLRHVSPGGTILCFEKEDVFTDLGRTYAAGVGSPGLHLRRAVAQRTPLPDGSVDAVFMEWPGIVLRAGLGQRSVREMARVLRPGGRLALSVRMCQVSFLALDQVPETRNANAYRDMEDSLEGAPLRRLETRVWTFTQHLGEQPALWFAERYLPRMVEPLAGKRYPQFPPSADVNVTVICEKT